MKKAPKAVQRARNTAFEAMAGIPHPLQAGHGTIVRKPLPAAYGHLVLYDMNTKGEAVTNPFVAVSIARRELERRDRTIQELRKQAQEGPRLHTLSPREDAALPADIGVTTYLCLDTGEVVAVVARVPNFPHPTAVVFRTGLRATPSEPGAQNTTNVITWELQDLGAGESTWRPVGPADPAGKQPEGAHFDELRNICENAPVHPGKTISHATARDCVDFGWAVRDANGDFTPTDQGRAALRARREALTAIAGPMGFAGGYLNQWARDAIQRQAADALQQGNSPAAPQPAGETKA